MTRKTRDDKAQSLTLRNFSVTRKGIVQGVTLTVPPGEFHVLLGPNGAGKSTTLRRLARALRAPLSMQFPEAQLILARKSVEGPHPLDLSLGEQRVVSVKAVTDAPYVLIDEPDAGIGPAHWEEIHALLAGALARGIAVVLACHDERFATDVETYACVETITILRQP